MFHLDDGNTNVWILVDKVAKHLKKTQINGHRAAKNKEPYLSQLISLSGSFHWAAHTTCLKGRTATEGQEAGLAIFGTSKIRASGVPLWRVGDLLTFFDSHRKFDSSRIDRWAREWASNSNEYLCWDSVPQDALVKFLPYERLVFRFEFPNDYFLRLEFVTSVSLGDFKKRFTSSPEYLTAEQYHSRVWSIVIELIDQMNPVKDIESFVEAVLRCFSNSSKWGYRLKRKSEDLMPKIRRMIAAEYAYGHAVLDVDKFEHKEMGEF